MVNKNHKSKPKPQLNLTGPSSTIRTELTVHKTIDSSGTQ